MTGGGSGRTAALRRRAALRPAAQGLLRGGSGARAASCGCEEPSFMPRRRSIAARARSLASRCSSGAMAASTGGAEAGAVTTGATAGWTGVTTGFAAVFSRSTGGCRRPSSGRLAVSAGFCSDFSAGFSAAFSAAGFSAGDFPGSIFRRCPWPGRLPPGYWPRSVEASAGAASFLRRPFRRRPTTRRRRRVGCGLGGDVVIDDIGPDDGRNHRRQDVHGEF